MVGGLGIGEAGESVLITPCVAGGVCECGSPGMDEVCLGDSIEGRPCCIGSHDTSVDISSFTP